LSQHSEAVCAFLFRILAWSYYADNAFGSDELDAQSTPMEWMGLGLTIIDSMDTAFIMSQKDIVKRCEDYVRNGLNFKSAREAPMFEIAIRILGSLLSMRHLTGKPIYLKKADELGELILKSFHSDSGIPHRYIKLGEPCSPDQHKCANGLSISIAEIGSIQLEFKYLAYLTGKAKYWNAVQNISKSLFSKETLDGLYPSIVSVQTGALRGKMGLGEESDSFYE